MGLSTPQDNIYATSTIEIAKDDHVMDATPVFAQVQSNGRVNQQAVQPQAVQSQAVATTVPGALQFVLTGKIKQLATTVVGGQVAVSQILHPLGYAPLVWAFKTNLVEDFYSPLPDIGFTFSPYEANDSTSTISTKTYIEFIYIASFFDEGYIRFYLAKPLNDITEITTPQIDRVV